MSFPSTVTDLTATTIEYRSKDIADNVTAHNAALYCMKEEGGVKPFDGGTVIQQNFSFAENANGGSYSGYDTLPTASQDVISGAQFRIAQYAVPVTFSGLESAINRGKEALIDLVEARVTVAENTMSNILNRHVYLDGTGNNSKNLTGLAAAVPLANTTGTYGGIDRSQSANSFWRNQKFQASVDGSGVATSSTITGYWNSFLITLSRGQDKPNLILAGQSVYSIFEASLQTIQRVTDPKLANAGFSSIQFQGIPVTFDTVAAGLTTTSAYFLNTKYLMWRPHSAFNMIALDDKQSVNQDATVKTLVWYGNMTNSGAKFQGIYSNT